VAAAAAIVVAAALTGAALGQPRAAARSTSLSHQGRSLVSASPLVVVGLGDSVPAGTACQCTAFVQLVADKLQRVSPERVAAFNDALAGLTSSGLLAQVADDDTVALHIAAASTVLVEIGANDVDYSRWLSPVCRRLTVAQCYRPQVERIEANIRAIIARIRQLRGLHETHIVVVDYWNVWQDGAVAAALGREFVHVSRQVTADVNRAIVAGAASVGDVDDVDLVAAFDGVGDNRDATALLAADGNHPNAAGHRVIADTIWASCPDLRQLPASASA
jgi:lysophospholipase L1-like esterase